MDSNKNIGVLGGGSWATAIVKMLTDNNLTVNWYMRDQDAIDSILKDSHNPKYLRGVHFDTQLLRMSNDINEVIKSSQVIILVIPSAFLNDELSKITTPLLDKIVFSAVKGIVPESELIVGEHLNVQFNIPYDQIGVITGPCHAEEVALERLSYLTIACSDLKVAKWMASQLENDYIRTKTSKDIIGTEYGAVLKNIYALASGIAHGLGYGDNFQAVLMSNSIREMKKIIKQVHKHKRNINHSAYLGDLLVTAYSVFSRNRMFGSMIGKGYTVKSAMMEMNMVAEGYYAAKSAYHIIEKKGMHEKAPIAEAVYEILYKNKSPKKTFQELTKKLS